MHNVFISYSTQDMEQALTVRKVLENNQITCWMAPADIPGGSNYTREIPIAIRGCQIFLLVLSQSAQKSQWVLKELETAVSAGKIILPFMLEECSLNDEFNFLLSGAQRYSAYQRKAEALEKLIIRIKAIVQSEDTVAESAPQETAPAGPAPELHGALLTEINNTRSDSIVCPACGSEDITEKKTIGNPNEPLEHILLIAVPLAMAIAAPMVALVLWAVFSTFIDFFYDFLEILIPLLSIGAVIGAVLWGKHMVRGWIHRRHVRKHISVRACRCNTCEKKFAATIRTSL